MYAGRFSWLSRTLTRQLEQILQHYEAQKGSPDAQQVLLLLGENLAHFKAGRPAFCDRNRRACRLHNRRRSESFRQRHRGSGEKSHYYYVGRFSGRAVYEHAKNVDPSLNCGQLDLRSCHSGFEGDRENWKAYSVVLFNDHPAGRYPGDCPRR